MVQEAQRAVTDPDSANNGSSPAKGTVPEADYLDMKRLHGEVTANLARAQAELTSVRALQKAAEDARVALEGRVKESDAVKVQLGLVQKELDTFKTSQLTSLRESLVQRGVAREKVEGKTLEQLSLIADVLPAVAKAPSKNGFDASGTGGSDVAGMTGRQKIEAGLAAQNSK